MVGLITGTGPVLALRWATRAAMVLFLLLSFLGTAPSNIKVNDWQVDAAPAAWKAVVRRWAHPPP